LLAKRLSELLFERLPVQQKVFVRSLLKMPYDVNMKHWKFRGAATRYTLDATLTV